MTSEKQDFLGAITIETTPTQLLVTIPVYVRGTQPANLVTDLDFALTQATGQDIYLRLVTLNMIESP